MSKKGNRDPKTPAPPPLAAEQAEALLRWRLALGPEVEKAAPELSLGGLGRLGFEAAVSRDYPVIFGTLYVFGLIGLMMGLVSDLMYVWIDPRIDFATRET